MTAAVTDYVCAACGTCFYDRPQAPHRCSICEDDRQYVPVTGQSWLSVDDLRKRHRVNVAIDDGLQALGLEPTFAINQRAILARGEHAAVLWEALPLVTDEAVEAITADGPVDCIALSHPHFYSAMQRWSEALGKVPILIHERDREWVPAAAVDVEFWRGDSHQIAPGFTLLNVGGHFPGSSALHWQDATQPDGVLLAGDALQVSANRRHVSFMYSYPNAIPMNVSAVERMHRLLAGYRFERVCGFTWKRNILSGGRASVEASFDRFLSAARD